MDTQDYQQYKEQSIYTMTQGELLLVLYDELVKRLTRAEMALDKQDYEAMEPLVQRGIDIIRYLDETLDFDYAISSNLHPLYNFFCYELSRVIVGRNQTELTRVRTMTAGLRDAFRVAEEKVRRGEVYVPGYVSNVVGIRTENGSKA